MLAIIDGTARGPGDAVTLPVALHGRRPCDLRRSRSDGTHARHDDEPADRGAPRPVDSKFSLVTLAARRARHINSYFNQLGDGPRPHGARRRCPSVARKPLSIGFEEIAADKILWTEVQHPEPAEDAAVDGDETLDEPVDA